MKQHSHEWFQARAGKVTASRVVDVMNFLKKGGEGADRKNYKAQLIAETLTGEPSLDGYVTPFMDWGNDNEDFARTAYELQTANSVDQVGFIEHPTIARFGASPDGLIGEEGGLELKCPKTETHLRWLLADEVPEEHRAQMYAGMSCGMRAWWDFASFDPRLPEPLQLFVKRLPRDHERIEEVENYVLAILSEVDHTIALLKEKVGDFPIGKQKQQQPAYAGSEGYLTDEDFAGLI